MKTHSYTRYSICEVWGKRDPVMGPSVHKYMTLAGAKSGLRTLQRDLRQRYMRNTWLRLCSRYNENTYQERKGVANRLRIVKKIESYTVLE